MTDRLTGVQQKIDRANHHIREYQVARDVFLRTNPYPVGAKHDPQARKPIYYVLSIRAVPDNVLAIAGEVLQSLRSALDHLAYQLALVGTGQPGPIYHVYFPIFDSVTKYETGKLGQIKGMRQDAIDAIDAVKPYKGGNDTLWRLHSLNKIDKHRLLFAAGGQIAGVDVLGDLANTFPDEESGKVFRETFGSLFIRPAERFPMEAGRVLFVGLSGDKNR